MSTTNDALMRRYGFVLCNTCNVETPVEEVGPDGRCTGCAAKEES
jgi:hypothetical protein